LSGRHGGDDEVAHSSSLFISRDKGRVQNFFMVLKHQTLEKENQEI
jgi:hypothetical protein